MLFSLQWLLELCPVEVSDSGRIADALTSRGLTVDSADGAALDLDIPANRPDCLGHRGVARELSAAFSVPLAAVGRSRAVDAASGPPVRVRIEDGELCQRYTASIVRGVHIGPSPDAVRRRLETCGLRSVNNVVDASNLVLLLLGHPIHFFDLDRLIAGDETGQPEIRVRRARDAERLTTLDGGQHELDSEMLVIADSGRPIALAGVMGGKDTEVHEGTTAVLIEAARFCPQSVRGTSRRLGLRSDASFRFERGVDACGAEMAQSVAADLLAELADAGAPTDRVDVGWTAQPARRLTVREARLAHLLGFEPGASDTLRALGALGLEPGVADGVYTVTVPSWRNDLEREADLVEEVARHLGYDRIPTRSAREGGGAILSPAGFVEPVEERALDVMAHRGFHEAINYSMIAAGEDDRFVEEGVPAALMLDNPIAEPLSHMRRSVLPGLLHAADLNLRRGCEQVRLFEIGRVFLDRSETLPHEPRRLGLAWSGDACEPHWDVAARPVDLFDIIGLVEHVVDALRPGLDLSRSPADLPAFHTGQSVGWRDADGSRIAWGGALHPELQRELERPVLLAEIELDRIVSHPIHPSQYARLPRVPAVSRDLSLILTPEVSHRQLLDTMRSVDPPAPATFQTVDRYEGPPLDPGQTSLSVRILLKPADRTLTDAETDAYVGALIALLQRELGVVLRG